MATFQDENDYNNQPQFAENQYEQGFVDYNQQEVDFSSQSQSNPPPLPPKNTTSEPAVEEEEEGIETTLDEPILITLVCFLFIIDLIMLYITLFIFIILYYNCKLKKEFKILM